MQRNKTQLRNRIFDILIIGGGIYGSSLAWRASLAGYSVALIEQNDFASGTSANSQKIIHGGLRYLQNFDFKRIADSIAERKRMMWLAPHLVKPLPVIMPVYGHGLKGKEAMTAGMTLYNILSTNRNTLKDKEKFIPPARLINKVEAISLLPALDQNNLQGAALWYDAFCSNTERLIISLIKTAVSYGAVVSNYLKATRLLIKNNKVTGIEAFDRYDKATIEIQGKNVINCTGSWNNELYPGNNKRIKYLAGINVVVDKALPFKYAAGLNDPNSGRMYVAVPWKNKFIIGTEWFNTPDPKKFEVTTAHITQLLQNFNNTYPDAALDISNVTFIHSGFVPAANENSAAMSEFRILDSSLHGLSGYYSVLGVKYTTAIDVAEKMLKIIYSYFSKLPLTKQPQLVGGEISVIQIFRKNIFEKWNYLFPIPVLDDLISEYGSEVEKILMLALQDLNNPSSHQRLMKAQVLFAIREEMALSLDDIVFRRTSIGSHEKPSSDILNYISEIASEELKWTKQQRLIELAKCEQKYFQEPTAVWSY